MMKTLSGLLLALAVTFVAASNATLALAEKMNFKIVSMVEKIETVKVSGLEGGVLGVLDRKGLSFFENGDVVTTSCRSIFDTRKGFQGYSTLVFDDGSTVVVSWQGPVTKAVPGSAYRQYSAPFTFIKGTGRYKGINGSGSFSAKAPQWDEDFKVKGFTYYEFAGTYNIASQ